MFTKNFWKDLAERAVSTAAQSALGAIGAGELFHLDWKVVAGTVAGATLLSVLKCLAATRVGAADSASLLPPSNSNSQ